jgi:sigma-54-specific transcriptional regulator
MPHMLDPVGKALLTMPDSPAGALSIRAKALVFNDPRSADLLTHVERIARSDASVLIYGETGTGKELIARHLHRESGRKGPFLAVNCGAFSESLIDAELFGHETGAFTGATQSRAGWFEAAQGGTLFLDEIGDLPLPLQVKLLRVLQERQVVRLGSRKPISLDVRLVTATNIDLRRAVEAQHFRADLFYRLTVATVNLPPLRERTGDIVPLATHFASVYAPRLGLGQVTLSPGAQEALTRYSWPGNIRELENVIHFASIVCKNACIEAEDLRLVASSHVYVPSSAPAPVPVPAPVPLPVAAAFPAVAEPVVPGPAKSALLPAVPGGEEGLLPEQVEAGEPVSKSEQASTALRAALNTLLESATADLYEQVERVLVDCAFSHVGENQVRAARALGVTRNTFRTLLKRHGFLADTSVVTD